MSNKRISLFDSQINTDEASISNKIWTRSEVIFKDIDTGEVLLTTHNKVVIAGSQFVAQKVFDLGQKVGLPSYNDSLNLEHSVKGEAPANTPKACLFCCGTQGCATESSAVLPVKYTNRIKPENDIVPFRYRPETNDISSELRSTYFGRAKKIDTKTAATYIAYYFKKFESNPELKMRYVDGTDIPATLYDSTNETDAETFVQMSLQITKDDFREYFKAQDEKGELTAAAKINCISIVTAWYRNDLEGDYLWYQDIIPLTQLNIPNEPLIDPTKGIDIIYNIYF